MRVSDLRAENFRNLEQLHLDADPRVNVIYGSNAQGKTNLIECIWMFSGARSFRGARDQELIRIGAQRARLELGFHAQERDQQAVLTIAEKRSAELNGIRLSCPIRFPPLFLLRSIWSSSRGRRRCGAVLSMRRSAGCGRDTPPP